MITFSVVCCRSTLSHYSSSVSSSGFAAVSSMTGSSTPTTPVLVVTDPSGRSTGGSAANNRLPPVSSNFILYSDCYSPDGRFFLTSCVSWLGFLSKSWGRGELITLRLVCLQLPSSRYCHTRWYDLRDNDVKGDMLRAPRIREGPRKGDFQYQKPPDDSSPLPDSYTKRLSRRFDFRVEMQNWENTTVGAVGPYNTLIVMVHHGWIIIMNSEWSYYWKTTCMECGWGFRNGSVLHWEGFFMSLLRSSYLIWLIPDLFYSIYWSWVWLNILPVSHLWQWPILYIHCCKSVLVSGGGAGADIHGRICNFLCLKLKSFDLAI